MGMCSSMGNKCLFRVECDVLFLSVLRREGEGLRIFWDRLREPSFTSRWNPFTTDFPYTTFTYHPVRDISDTFTSICNVRALISRGNYHRLEFKKNYDFLLLGLGVMDSPTSVQKKDFSLDCSWAVVLLITHCYQNEGRSLTWLDCYDESKWRCELQED